MPGRSAAQGPRRVRMRKFQGELVDCQSGPVPTQDAELISYVYLKVESPSVCY
jgi:hypothetical protein